MDLAICFYISFSQKECRKTTLGNVRKADYQTNKTNEGKSQRRKIIDLKSVSDAFIFSQSNGISTLPELGEKVNAMRGEFNTARENSKPVERRLNTSCVSMVGMNRLLQKNRGMEL